MNENSTFFDIILYVGYFLIAVALIAAIVMPLVKSLSNPRSLISIGAGLVALIVIFLISYALADNEIQPQWSLLGITEGGSKLIGGTIITMYMLIALALLGIAVTEVSKLFR